MSESIDIAQLQAAFARGQIHWQRHALEQMLERNISRQMVRDVILTGERIEDYPDDWPLPSALFLGWSTVCPIHVVAAFDHVHQIAYVITAYQPTSEYFEADFRTRKKHE